MMAPERLVRRLPVVAVLGSGTEAWGQRTAALGTWLAHAGVHLLTGGGAGVMRAVAEAYCAVASRPGYVIGVLPAAAGDPGHPPVGYPNPYVEIALHTHLPLTGARGAEPLSRNHINVLSADAAVALPGSAGTASEIVLALRYGCPLIAWLQTREEMADLPDAVPVATDLQEVVRFVRGALAARGWARFAQADVSDPVR